jgi:Mlc titration factor MtfA (ptsG expression regulator)
MFDAFRKWRERQVLRSAALPEPLWRKALEAQPFLAIYTDEELARLRDKVVLFLHAKGIIGAGGHEVTPLERTVIALQACVLVLNLDFALYDDFENVIVYPGEFIPGWEWEDEYGVVHRNADPLAGEAMPGGPVVLSWPDVAASSDWDATGMNLVIHEFAHKLDMRDGDANGCPPLPRDMPPQQWKRALHDAYEHFHARVEKGVDTAIDPYAAESPAEFFAVLSEVFFADPTLLQHEYPRVYEQLGRFYRQDPAARTALPTNGGLQP